MTILEVTRMQIKPGAGELIKKLTNNRCCLNLLRFFMLHPNGRFSKLAVIHALDDSGRISEVENALRQLVIEGVVNTRAENAVCLYQLTHQEPQRHILLNLAKFDWRQWQMVLELL